MFKIPFSRSSENLWQQASLRQGTYETYGEFTLREATAHSYQGPPPSMTRADSNPRINGYPSVCQKVASVKPYQEKVSSPAGNTFGRQPYHFSLPAGPVRKNNIGGRERCANQFTQHDLKNNDGPRLSAGPEKKNGFLKAVWNLFRCFIPCVKVKAQNH